jgi:uncharacterized Fe-S center protein
MRQVDLVNHQAGFTDSLLTAHHGRGQDKFKGVHAQTDGVRQITYAEEIGMGTGTYDLIPI